jgi:hypothetical protein
MKLQIVHNDNESIEGFISLKISDNPKSDLSQIVNHSCTDILVLDIIDSFEYNQSFEFLSEVLSKIRLNGSLLLRGVSSLAFSHALLNGSIDSNKASNIISEIKSIHDQRDITTLLESNDFRIDTMRLNGVSYELKATRQNVK